MEHQVPADQTVDHLQSIPEAAELLGLDDDALRQPFGDVLIEGFGHAAWVRLDQDQLGVNVIDPDGHRIGSATCVRRFYLGIPTGGWRPIDGYKHVLVGELDYYSFYDPAFGQGEADFNLDIYPNRPFRMIRDDAVAMMGEEDRGELIQRKRGEGIVVECEVTPDETYRNSLWFPTREHGQSPLVGGQVGVYGPWVGDLAHGGRPEIHPCEVIWWRNGSVDALSQPHAAFVRWRVIVLQDDSNRFDRTSDYTSGISRPWSASPRTAHIIVALGAISGSRITYNVAMADGRRVHEWPGEDGRTITRNFGGSPTVVVHKRMSRPSEVKMRLGGLARDPNDPAKLRCFLEMWIRVGEGDRGKEGFAEVTVEAWGPAAAHQDDEGGGNPPRPPRPPHEQPGRPPGTQEP